MPGIKAEAATGLVRLSGALLRARPDADDGVRCASLQPWRGEEKRFARTRFGGGDAANARLSLPRSFAFAGRLRRLRRSTGDADAGRSEVKGA